jgi:hypothetical protein
MKLDKDQMFLIHLITVWETIWFASLILGPSTEENLVMSLYFIFLGLVCLHATLTHH